MRAIHVPTGVSFEASEISEKSELKAGPWRCDTRGCAAVFKGHRRASHRVPRNGGEPTVVAATFVSYSREDHIPSCGNRTTHKDADVTGTVQRHEIIHLDLEIGVHSPRSGQRHGEAPSYSRSEYKARVRNVHGLRLQHDEVLQSGDVMSSLVVCDGTQYRWWELVFGPSQSSLTRVRDEIRRAFHLTDRPWLVRGTVASAPRMASNENPYVILRGNDASGLPPIEDRVNVVAPKTSDAAAAIRALKEDDTIAVLSTNASILSRNHNPWVEIAETGQLEVIKRHM